MLASLATAGKVAVIACKANRLIRRERDRDCCKARRLAENLFAKLKPFRAIATRCGKTARTFLAGVHLAAAIWLN